jgi:predicted enzyme related to lactoylglutathione lyase
MQPSRIVGFVGVTSLDRAAHFYGDVLGLTLADERPYALVLDQAGGMLRITEVAAVSPAPYTVVGLGIDDIDAEVAALTRRGVEFTRYDGIGQDQQGIWTSPGGGRIAWFTDPDGNTLSLTQFRD